MKKYLIIILLFFCSLFFMNFNVSYSYVDCSNYVIKPVEVNSLNFNDYISKINYKEIYGVCSYDFCYNFNTGDVNKGISDFNKLYYNSVSDDDKLVLMVKGIPITDIMINNCK